MLVRNSAKAKAVKPQAEISKLIESVSEEDLRQWVTRLAVPRHFVAQPKVNRRTAELIADYLTKWGYDVSFQGTYYNVVAKPPGKMCIRDSLGTIGEPRHHHSGSFQYHQMQR